MNRFCLRYNLLLPCLEFHSEFSTCSNTMRILVIDIKYGSSPATPPPTMLARQLTEHVYVFKMLNMQMLWVLGKNSNINTLLTKFGDIYLCWPNSVITKFIRLCLWPGNHADPGCFNIPKWNFPGNKLFCFWRLRIIRKTIPRPPVASSTQLMKEAAQTPLKNNLLSFLEGFCNKWGPLGTIKALTYD